MSLENLSKKELAEKVRELAEKLKEVKNVEHQVNASVETLKDGNKATGVVGNSNGTFTLVNLVFDLEKNAAAIISTELIGSDGQIAAARLIKEAGQSFYKAAGIK